MRVTFDFDDSEPISFLSGIQLAEALQLWREASCEEFTGGRHSLQLIVENGTAMVACEVCHYNPLGNGDLQEFLYFGPIPIDLRIESIVHPGGPWGGTEYDVEVEATAR